MWRTFTSYSLPAFTGAFDLTPCVFYDEGIAFQPADKEGAGLNQRSVPVVIGKTAVEDNEGTFGQLQRLGPMNLMAFAISD